jgi:hypothetical protein
METKSMQLVHQETLIRERAYAIWEQEGRPEGREWDHWVRAASEMQTKPVDAIAQSRPATAKARAARSKARKPSA